jgi:Transmembrane exosortase (Exosortase_EpsH)
VLGACSDRVLGQGGWWFPCREPACRRGDRGSCFWRRCVQRRRLGDDLEARRRPCPERPASPRLVLTALGLGLLCAVPVDPALVLALAALGSGVLLQSDVTGAGRQAGLLLLVLAGSWASPDLRPLHVAIAHWDAQTVGWVMHLAGASVVVRGNLVINGNFAIEVLSDCASSAPLAQVILAFVVIALYRRGSCRRADAPWLLASLLASVVLTEIRLSLMAISHADYSWWHDGLGVTVYGLVALAPAIAFPLLSTAGATNASARNPRTGQLV